MPTEKRKMKKKEKAIYVDPSQLLIYESNRLIWIYQYYLQYIF